MYPVMSRGDRREDIFLDDVARQVLPENAGQACQKTDWQVHAYGLMRNHYYLVLETPNANLVSGSGYLRTAGDYGHLNPVRAGLLKVEERLLAYPWSSFGAYLAAAERHPGWVRVDRLLGRAWYPARHARGPAGV